MAPRIDDANHDYEPPAIERDLAVARALAQPWFRIFNPVRQSQRFDPHGRFIRLDLPELGRVPERFVHAPWTMSEAQQVQAGLHIGRDYPAPIVDHARAREAALRMYGRVRGSR